MRAEISDDRHIEERASGLRATTLFLLGLAFWMLSHPYRGIFHDARLYTLQALSRLSPGALSQDVFLRFGSQERFTLFSPVYAAVIHLLGPDSAAALLTVLSQGAILATAWLLARSILSPRLAAIGLALVIAMPGVYGTDQIFAVIEPFLTPRMAAEALVLASLAAALKHHSRISFACLALAALMHPIMAAAGALPLWYLLLFGSSRRFAAWALLGLLLLVVLAQLLIPELGPFDAIWLRLVRSRSPYLFVSNWTIEDWGRLAVPLVTLYIGARELSSARAKALCHALLLTGITGITVSFLGGDRMHLVWVTQLQPWRWQWLDGACAALLLPAISEACFRSGVQARIAGLLLAAAWIFGEFSAYVCCLVLLALALTPRLKPSESRWVLWGAMGLLAMAVVWRVATNLEFTDAHHLELQLPAWQRHLMSFVQDGSAPLGVLAITSWLMRSPKAIKALLPVALIAAGISVLLLPRTWAQWSAREFPPLQVREFASWRASIAPDAEVFWPDSPLSAWILLDRPSYLSVAQSAGIVFSRRTALELQRRAIALQSVVPAQSFLDWDDTRPTLGLSAQQLHQTCQLAVFDYLITSEDLGIQPVAVMQSNEPAYRNLRLYRCASGAHARAAAAAT